MKDRVTYDAAQARSFFSEEDYHKIREEVLRARQMLLAGNAPGNDFLGWVNWPECYDREELARIKETAAKIREESETVIVIGIGGSYLGARAANEFLRGRFYNDQPRQKRKGPKIYYCGNSLSSTYLSGVLDIMEFTKGDIAVNVISKSGTTTEPAIAFRFVKEKMEARYGREGAAKRIYATTDMAKGALKTLADDEGYETFVVPNDIGGRFSVLSAVGLLPIASLGSDVERMLEGAADMRDHLVKSGFEENDALQYAAVRNLLYRDGKSVEILANYEPRLHYIGEWWKQLQGESEGKDHKGIFPTTADLSTDLHSMGQYIQDGRRFLMETVMNVEKPYRDMKLKKEENDLDGLNYLAGHTIDFANKCAMNGTMLAHMDGQVPTAKINIPEVNEYYLGQLFYFFEFECGVSGYTLGVNPFNQPGVESYKKNMFALLGKPGYEEAHAELWDRLLKM